MGSLYIEAQGYVPVLPSLDVVAVSQAPSPESNPDSPSPVVTMVGTATTVRICMVCLALELVGPWVVLGFSVGMEAFDELLLINVLWSQEFSDVLRIWN